MHQSSTEIKPLKQFWSCICHSCSVFLWKQLWQYQVPPVPIQLQYLWGLLKQNIYQSQLKMCNTHENLTFEYWLKLSDLPLQGHSGYPGLVKIVWSRTRSALWTFSISVFLLTCCRTSWMVSSSVGDWLMAGKKITLFQNYHPLFLSGIQTILGQFARMKVEHIDTLQIARSSH